MNETKEVEIDLMQLVRVLWKKIPYILIVTVIFGAIGLSISTFFMTPVYSATAKMLVNTRIDQNQTVTNDQINSARNLVATYAIIVQSRTVLEPVIQQLRLDMTYAQLANSVTVEGIGTTQVMNIVVKHPDPATAQAIAEKILQIAPQIIMDTVGAGSVKTVENAYAGNSPVSPSIGKNTVIAALLGFVLTCGFFVIVFLLDNTYKSELDIQNGLQLPVLGVIPTIESCDAVSASHQGRRA